MYRFFSEVADCRGMQRVEVQMARDACQNTLVRVRLDVTSLSWMNLLWFAWITRLPHVSHVLPPQNNTILAPP